jgi:rod shape-determining protein MreB and related proteins
MSEKKQMEKDEILAVGIDLGTSRSAISSSAGERRWVESYVGWPKDFVARKLLGKRVLFGEEALEQRLSLNLFRPLEAGVIKEGTDKDAESIVELLGHLIDLVGPAKGQRIHAAVGIPAEALKVNRSAIRKAVSKFADKLIVVSEPFSVAYGLNALENAMVIDIGAGTTDFCIMHGAMPTEEDQRSLSTAGDYVDQQLFKLLSDKYPQADFTLTMVRRFKEKFGFVGAGAKKIEVEIPVHGKMIAHEISGELRKSCESIVPAIAETTIDLIAKFDPEFQAKVRGNIILAGGGSRIAGLADYLTKALADWAPCTITCVEEPLFAGADGALELARDMPEEYWEAI